MTRTLIDITEDMQALDDLLTEVGGDITDPKVEEAIAQWFAELDKDLMRKVDGYAAFITELLGRASIRKSESERLANLAQVDENVAKNLKNRLKYVMESKGMPKLQTDRYRIAVTKNGGHAPMDIHEPEKIPRDLCKHIPERYDPDVDAIRKALSNNIEVPGVILQPRGTHLRIS